MASFLDRIRNSIKAFNTNVTAESYNRFIYNFLGDSVIPNNVYNDDYIDKGYSHNTSIYSIINLIIQSSTSVPYKIYKKVDDGAFKEYKSLTSNGLNQESLLQSKFLKKSTFEEIENTALQQLLEKPNPSQGFSTFLAEMIGFGKLTGNRYIYGIYPDTKKIVKELYNLPAHLVQIKSDGIFKPIDKYVMQYRNTDYELDAAEVLHIADWNPDYSSSIGSHLYGQSPIKAAMRILATNNEAIETQLKYLHNQTSKGMLVPDDDSLTPTQAQQLSDAMQRNFGGSANANKVMITGKKFSWVNFGLTTTDLQLLETYQATISDLCNVYGVPVQLLNNTDSSTYDNYRTARKVLFTNAIIPELNRIRDEFNRWLVPQFGEDLYFDFDYTVIPELMPEQQQLVDNLSKSYWLSTNEKREAVGYGIVEDNPILDDYLVPSGFVPISDLDMSVSDDVTFPAPPERPEADANEEEDVVDEEEIEEVREEEEKLEKQETYSNYPKSAVNNAKRAKEINESFNNPCATLVGKNRASDLIAGRGLSLSIVKKTYSYLSRANEYVTGKYTDEKGKPICGDISYALWGGSIRAKGVDSDPMANWCKRIIEKNED